MELGTNRALSNMSESLLDIDTNSLRLLMEDFKNEHLDLQNFVPSETEIYQLDGTHNEAIEAGIDHYLDINPPTRNHYETTNNMTALDPVQSHFPSNSIPSNEEFGGQYNFEIKLNTSHTSKLTWVYSSLLNKAFITMGSVLPVDVKCSPPISGLFLRATPLFACPEYSQEPVVRCLNHALGTDITNKDVHESIHKHVMRCNNQLANYVNQNNRLSVIIPLEKPQAGTDSVRVTFKFMCKNSCPSGMNRRPLEIIYTLETIDGEILGRQKHGLRICSCPKRDKEKEEEEYINGSKKRRKKPAKVLPKKICKEEPLDDTLYELSIKIKGRNNAIDVLKLAFNVMAGDGFRHNSLPLYQDCMNDIATQISELKGNRT